DTDTGIVEPQNEPGSVTLQLDLEKQIELRLKSKLQGYIREKRALNMKKRRQRTRLLKREQDKLEQIQQRRALSIFQRILKKKENSPKSKKSTQSNKNQLHIESADQLCKWSSDGSDSQTTSSPKGENQQINPVHLI